MPITEWQTKIGETPLKEADRIMQICNACRYCEGFCAVFPAMNRRLTFNEADLNYLANLCHNCGACLPACQYGPPHQFMVNVPQTLAQVRGDTYKTYAWPKAAGRLYQKNGLACALITAASITLFLIAVFWAVEPRVLYEAHVGEGSFYKIFSHATMVTIFGLAGLYVLLAFIMGFRNFWADMGEKMGDFATPGAFGQALWDAGTLKYMDGGGDGCTDPDKPPSYLRQEFHHLTSYGFLLCFAATCAGTLIHYIGGRAAPYGMASVPVVLGTIGGIGLLIGPAGLLWIKWKTDPMKVDERQRGMDVGFLVLLFLTSLTGFLLLAWRETPAMGVTLAVHLGVVLGLFLTMPYGKFVHAIYRFAALVRFALEMKRPNTNASFEG